MQLQGLPRGHPQRGVAHLIAKPKFGEHLRTAELAAGYFGPDHHGVGLTPAILAGRFAFVPIVLLVAAVMFDQLDAALAEEGVFVEEFLGNLPPQKMALLLESFNRTRFGRIGLGGGWLAHGCKAGLGSRILAVFCWRVSITGPSALGHTICSASIGLHREGRDNDRTDAPEGQLSHEQGPRSRLACTPRRITATMNRTRSRLPKNLILGDNGC